MKDLRAPFVLLFVFACAEQAEDHFSLESRLLAPCCYKQTLDVHSSELANAVRSEVRARMKDGASATEVEAELVARYGERIRAVPDRNFLRPVGIAGMGFVAVAFLAFYTSGFLSRRRAAATEMPARAENLAARSELEAELRELD